MVLKTTRLELESPYRDGILRDKDTCRPDFGCMKLAKTRDGDRFVCWLELRTQTE